MKITNKNSLTFLAALLLTASTAFSQTTPAPVEPTAPTAEAIPVDTAPKPLPTVFQTDFSSGIAEWELKDTDWKVKKTPDGNAVFSQFTKASTYQPTVRSPFHQALLKEKIVTDFQLDVRVLSTHPDYKHRDACLFFGYQSPTQFYYVHLGKKTDPYANQIFIVNNADRVKISLTTTPGTDWDDDWHNVRIERDVASGDIKVFFDDMEKPVMTANDKTFVTGRVGLGSFDDTADWDDFKLLGKVLEKTP